MDENNTEFGFSMLLASTTHDMKNSLGMLLTSLGDLMEEYPAQNDEQRRRYAVLQGEASRMSNDLVSLLGLFRLENRQLRVQVDEVIVEDFIGNQLATNEILFATRPIQVSVECDPELSWYFDEELLTGVLNNVLVNACKYTRSQIIVAARIGNEGLEISVSDDGSGFPEGMIADPLEYNRGISFGTGSTKLGLFFAAQIAALHRNGDKAGYIALNNRPEGGGCFRIVLP